MRSIESKEDYLEVLSKYAERLKLAQARYSDFKRERSALQQALELKPPASATEEELRQYQYLQTKAHRSLKLIDDFVSEYDAMFAAAAKTLKMGR